MERTILVVGHGSRVPEAVEEFRKFVGALARRFDVPVDHCFLELVEPDMATGLSEAVQRVGKGGEVDVLPLFLGSGGHQKNDVAASIQWARDTFPDVTFRYAVPLGPHAKLIELLDRRVDAALDGAEARFLPEATRVLVIGRGSSDPDSCGEVARSAYLLFHKRPYLSVEYAFQAVASPDMEEGIRRCHALGAKQIVVAPYILFTGKVIEDIHRVTQLAGEKVGLPVLMADYFGAHPLLIDVAEQRLREAMEGTISMSCDVCRYRHPMAGHEHEVGLPQATHHLHGGEHHHHHHHDVPAEHDHE